MLVVLVQVHSAALTGVHQLLFGNTGGGLLGLLGSRSLGGCLLVVVLVILVLLLFILFFMVVLLLGRFVLFIHYGRNGFFRMFCSGVQRLFTFLDPLTFLFLLSAFFVFLLLPSIFNGLFR